MLTNYTQNKKSRLKLYGIIGAAITLIIPFFLMLQNDNNHLESDQSLCPFKMLTGFPCPGCGITKSIVYFFQGDVMKSLAYHLFGPATVLFCIIVIGVLSFELSTGKTYCKKWFYNTKIAYALAVFLMVYHLSRIIYFVHTNTIDSILQQSIWK